MTIDTWLQAAIADAARRGLSEMTAGLEALARATRLLRAGDFNQHANGDRSGGSRRQSTAGGPES